MISLVGWLVGLGFVSLISISCFFKTSQQRSLEIGNCWFHITQCENLCKVYVLPGKTAVKNATCLRKFQFMSSRKWS